MMEAPGREVRVVISLLPRPGAAALSLTEPLPREEFLGTCLVPRFVALVGVGKRAGLAVIEIVVKTYPVRALFNSVRHADDPGKG